MIVWNLVLMLGLPLEQWIPVVLVVEILSYASIWAYVCFRFCLSHHWNRILSSLNVLNLTRRKSNWSLVPRVTYLIRRKSNGSPQITYKYDVLNKHEIPFAHLVLSADGTYWHDEFYRNQFRHFLSLKIPHLILKNIS